MCISGMYDLTPVRLPVRNAYVAFDDATVAALSPMRHLDRLQAPLVVAYGTCETPEFQRQNREFAVLLLTRRVKSERVYAEIDWSLLLVFAGLFIIVAGAQRALLTPDLVAAGPGHWLPPVADAGPWHSPGRGRTACCRR
jgi:hypothetical protein